ncbi:MAG: hypothetical protein HON23_05775 [Rickettsiales bacterium]|jgi:biopolymer transport protein ExbB/TolQ|nr:hypothetical protein [Rickettsiales bacterium]
MKLTDFLSPDPIVSSVLILLMFMSFLSWTIIFNKFFLIKKAHKKIKDLKDLAKNFKKFSKDYNNPDEKIFFAQNFSNLDNGQLILASVGSSAPFIGLLGTVWGIKNALQDISVSGQASIDIIAGPIGEALIATAVGLFAAIPAVVFYNYFNNEIGKLFFKAKLSLNKK